MNTETHKKNTLLPKKSQIRKYIIIISIAIQPNMDLNIFFLPQIEVFLKKVF